MYRTPRAFLSTYQVCLQNSLNSPFTCNPLITIRHGNTILNYNIVSAEQNLHSMEVPINTVKEFVNFS